MHARVFNHFGAVLADLSLRFEAEKPTIRFIEVLNVTVGIRHHDAVVILSKISLKIASLFCSDIVASGWRVSPFIQWYDHLFIEVLFQIHSAKKNIFL